VALRVRSFTHANCGLVEPRRRSPSITMRVICLRLTRLITTTTQLLPWPTTLDQSFTDTGGTGGGWQANLSTGRYSAKANAGWTDANIQGLTSTAYRTTYSSASGAQMGDLSPNMGSGGGGSSEDSTGPQAYWVELWLFSMGQGADHGLRMFLKMRGNADISTAFPFHWREGRSGVSWITMTSQAAELASAFPSA
jgi:hypothetical protein